jgi:uncharacterized RDD family membrane protein YckC
MILLSAAGAFMAMAEGAVFVERYAGIDLLEFLFRRPWEVLGAVGLWGLAMGVLSWSYFVLLRAACGRTLGEAVWGVRVVGEGGENASVAQCVCRGAGALVSLLPLGAGFWWAFAGRQGRSWHERWSRTRSARNWPFHV